ncbi:MULTISPECIES: restriction endonuclease subunit S [unclassified Acinetobacter]|uniref:restriction endonuclease subunit S n=1 Tax=unclassified Acinetobacter TaxID=196816 RepID=UPI0015D40229|nr:MULTISPECIES: restriction endonuclease subunit S [unclassified Acinetobacter]
MAKYEKYTEYQDSGVEWLGEIPSHWQASYVGVLSDVIDPQPDHRAPAISEDGEGFPYIGIRDVNKDGTLNFETARPVEESAVLKQERSFTIEPHNIIFCKVGTLGLPRKIIPHGRCALSATLVLIKARKINSQFLLYALDSDCIISQTNFLATGSTRAALGIQQIRKFRIPFPPLLDQLAIANFLDHETAQIDTLIAKQEKLIELLKEKRQAVISHAVTKGLNSDVTMKDSGVEWLGQVPEHWKVSKLKWKAVTTSGSTPTTSKYELYYENGDIPWIRTTDLNNSDLYETPIYITSRAVNDTACSVLPINSILIAMYGGAGSIGKHSLLKFESTINQAVCGVLPSKVYDPDYLHRFYEFYRPFWMIGASGTRKDPNIGQDHIKEAFVPIPPLDEQRQIAQYISEIQTKFDALTKKAESAIQLMQERRTALISFAVTGKIDVRNWQVPHKNNKANTEKVA